MAIFNNDKEYNKAYKSLLMHKIYVKGGYKGVLKNGILFTCGPKKFEKIVSNNKEKYMNILITGGNGFLGSNLAKKFLNNRHDVTILDNKKIGLA